jgi:hypothetical protein
MNIFDYESVKDKRQEILDAIQAEYKGITISTLGGIENTSIILHLSLDKKDTWQNGIFHNSRYFIIHISKNGIVENFSCGNRANKLRKKTVKSLQQAIEYINKGINKEIK